SVLPKDTTPAQGQGLDPAQHFKQTSQKVARSYWWKNVKLIVVIIVIVLIVVLIIILLATGVIPTSAP
uniref:V-SNARE coiled-coil homology domain-containing protein n=1 Tax=Amphilophus citrinellus TaxID=61819 RepID=A0A3Q0S203_AMPCI